MLDGIFDDGFSHNAFDVNAVYTNLDMDCTSTYLAKRIRLY